MRREFDFPSFMLNVVFIIGYCIYAPFKWLFKVLKRFMSDISKDVYGRGVKYVGAIVFLAVLGYFFSLVKLLMTSRNEKCPCGSGKKYKQCFLAVNSNCKDLLEAQKLKFINDHPSRNKTVFKFFNEAVGDIATAFRKDDKGGDVVASRVQMVSVFTFIDIVASYWFEYLGKNGTPKERFLVWFSRFCLTEDNKEYKSNSELRKITASRSYSFRSSMVHFFGLSGFEEDKYMLLATNDRPEPEIEELKKQLKKGARVVVITKSEDWHRLVTDGAKLMLEEMQNDIDKSQMDETKAYAHMYGIDRIFKKTQKEGAVKIPANSVNM